MSSRSESLLITLMIAYGHKQQSNKIGSGQNDGLGGGGGGYGSGDSDGDRDGNDNGGGNGYGNGDSGINNGDAGDDGVDGDDGDDGDDGSGMEEIGGGGRGSGDGGGNGCSNALGRLPTVNDATFMTMTFLTRPPTLMRCQASARGRPPKTNSIRRRIDNDDIG
jgi:hypothetical protein